MQKELLTPAPIREELLPTALKHAKSAGGRFITTVDVLVAYLVLTEPTTKVLFNHQLKEGDIEDIALWTRVQFDREEKEKKRRVVLWGEGIGQDWVSGWTLETKKYTQSVTSRTVNSAHLTRGREKEYKELQEVLSKKEQNNVIFIGETGAGKETLVEALAQDSFLGNLAPALNYKRVLELLVGELLAGLQTKGELQERLGAILEEVSHAGDIILYIPEFQNVLGASSFDLDISDVLSPYLRDGRMPIIATMSSGNYKNFMEKSLLKEEFTTIVISQPDEKQALTMLFAKIVSIEKTYGVSISYKAAMEAIQLAGKYIMDSVLPGNAVILLEDVASNIAQQKEKVVLPEHITAKVEEKTHLRVGVPKKEEKDLLLHLEDVLHQRIVGQETAVDTIAQSFRRLRSGISAHNRPLSFLFLGPTGVGKTETAKALAAVYFGKESAMIRLDMSEYSDEIALAKLLGMPNGTQRGELTEKIHDNPFSLILLDEFEKANPSVLNLFLQVLEDGRLTDTAGKTVSFADTIIIATSNAASELIREAIEGGMTIDAGFQSKLLDFLQQKAIFKPELLNRFDAIVAFRPLSPSEVEKVVQLLLEDTTAKLKEQDIALIFDPAVAGIIAKQGYDATFGARPLRRFIQDKIEDMLARKLLEGSLSRGASVTMHVDASGNIVTS